MRLFSPNRISSNKNQGDDEKTIEPSDLGSGFDEKSSQASLEDFSDRLGHMRKELSALEKLHKSSKKYLTVKHIETLLNSILTTFAATRPELIKGFLPYADTSSSDTDAKGGETKALSDVLDKLLDDTKTFLTKIAMERSNLDKNGLGPNCTYVAEYWRLVAKFEFLFKAPPKLGTTAYWWFRLEIHVQQLRTYFCWGELVPATKFNQSVWKKLTRAVEVQNNVRDLSRSLELTGSSPIEVELKALDDYFIKLRPLYLEARAKNIKLITSINFLIDRLVDAWKLLKSSKEQADPLALKTITDLLSELRQFKSSVAQQLEPTVIELEQFDEKLKSDKSPTAALSNEQVASNEKKFEEYRVRVDEQLAASLSETKSPEKPALKPPAADQDKDAYKREKEKRSQLFLWVCDKVDNYLAKKMRNPITDSRLRDWLKLITIFSNAAISDREKYCFLERSINHFSTQIPDPGYADLLRHLAKLLGFYPSLISTSRKINQDLHLKYKCYLKQLELAEQLRNVLATGIMDPTHNEVKSSASEWASACGSLSQYSNVYRKYQIWRDQNLPILPVQLMPSFAIPQATDSSITPSGVINLVANHLGEEPFQVYRKMISLVPKRPRPLILAPSSALSSAKTASGCLKAFLHVERYLAGRAFNTNFESKYFNSVSDYLARRESWLTLWSDNFDSSNFCRSSIDEINRFSEGRGRSHRYAEALTNLRAVLQATSGQDLQLKRYIKARKELFKLELIIVKKVILLNAKDFHEDLWNYQQAYREYLKNHESLLSFYEPATPQDALYSLSNNGLLQKLFPPTKAYKIYSNFLKYVKNKSSAAAEETESVSLIENSLSAPSRPPTPEHAAGEDKKQIRDKEVKSKPLIGEQKVSQEDQKQQSSFPQLIAQIKTQKKILHKKSAKPRFCNLFPSKENDHADIRILDKLLYYLSQQAIVEITPKQGREYLSRSVFSRDLAALKDFSVRAALSDAFYKARYPSPSVPFQLKT